MSPKKTEEQPCIVLSNGDVMAITDGDKRRLLQRMNQGGVLEGAYALDSGVSVSLAHVMFVSPRAMVG